MFATVCSVEQEGLMALVGRGQGADHDIVKNVEQEVHRHAVGHTRERAMVRQELAAAVAAYKWR